MFMRMLSIIGDSISTYDGYNPEGYSVFYDKELQKRNNINNVHETWWARVMLFLNARLCVNNSFSGSQVSGVRFPAASCDERIQHLGTSRNLPDIILIYIGFNDFGNGVKIYRSGIQDICQKRTMFFSSAYEEMILKVRQLYPKARVICGTLMRTHILNKKSWVFPESYAGVLFEEYNAAIRNTCRKHSCDLADLDALNTTYKTLDGSHPTKKGHTIIADAWEKCLADLGYVD